MKETDRYICWIYMNNRSVVQYGFYHCYDCMHSFLS
uniref:DUF2197 domain-containing protein n=1 Tax=Heterorhabditis bacteriophora TaxID=37862 RepID=A0A1I7WVL3_HETBA